MTFSRSSGLILEMIWLMSWLLARGRLPIESPVCREELLLGRVERLSPEED